VINPEQIPDEVAEAFIATLYGEPGLPYRKAIAAAINVWPGIEIHTDGTEDWIELTLMQENNNGSD
jgi:hypothetical protein